MAAIVGAGAYGPGEACWQKVCLRLAALLAERQIHPARTVVLLPYAQLMQQARDAWAATAGDTHFVPRFETTMNWVGSLGGWEPAAGDIRLDAAHDLLTAALLLESAGLGRQQEALAPRLVEAAAPLARLAAAVPPAQRTAWGVRMAVELGAGLDSPLLQLEAALGRIALAWVAASAYPSDVLFADHAPVDLLVLVEGFQSEPLHAALQAHFGERAVLLELDAPGDAVLPAIHAAQDADDEAQRTAACVLAHLAQGRSPVALIAQDRELTRRVRAMLGERGVAIRDETGWKLSTTRAAATLVGLLRALSWQASCDTVLDWLKNAPAFEAEAVAAAEKELRQAGVRDWRTVTASLPACHAMAGQMQALRDGLQRARPLPAWLRDLRVALQSAGQWDGLAGDVAGQAVLDALRLHEGAEAEFADAGRMNLSDFSNWVNHALEDADFRPAHPPQEQVIILPLSQLLGRIPQAVVLAGCDELHLAVSPEPGGLWTPAQRALLGLPSREALSEAQSAAWRYALRFSHLDVLWRESEGGERLMPSGFVQELLLLHAPPVALDPRQPRLVNAQPTARPLPTGEALPVRRLSASAYDDLRRCPYRFFALRQLRLQEADELDSELGKRDFGNWLHTLLKLFHDALKQAPAQTPPARIAMINIAAEQAARDLALSDSEFLPFAASWPRVRDGYLAWLADHEAAGAVFEAGEVSREVPLGALSLIGKIDRIDKFADGSTLVMDYKTEARATTAERLKQPQEDTQLAFYAGLLEDDTLAAAYINLGEKEATRTYEQPDIVALRDELLDSIVTDMARVARGTPLPALGEGKACEYCAARGLCRKDFWS
ncbi:PD-(D/E)XK nuclease family protein [Polaromonas sp.]|uniref:PD-(D/E)XK nuclease family protein n=1 Tax=Polaromonas sp. TaxID=1869339 RepID=UPI0027307F3C|nr:PD-(D/E)XK nuclease family protein [Polaromonas sp.]MDP1740891.1 PD-(D/E)XK nuclease family protein [Polaromonas sp.]